MIYINAFKNYDEFKNMFGMVEHGNGKKSRRNAILMAFYKCQAVRQRFINANLQINIKTMDDLKSIVLNWLYAGTGKYQLNLNGYFFSSDKYSTDSLNGLCEDGDTTQVRVIIHEGEREIVRKTRPGRLLKQLIQENTWTKILPEQVTNWMCEEFAREWAAYAESESESYELHIDKDFERIYDPFLCAGDFHSCMTGHNQHSFYEDAVKAHAAYLTDDNDKVVARCIIFDEVFDENDNVYRYAERQYSSEDSDKLKQILISKLIAGKHIDCYKRVGVDCHNSRSIVNVRGESMSDIKLSIGCCLDTSDTLSYQDTFKWYDINKEVSYNYYHPDYDYKLDITDRTLVGSCECPECGCSFNEGDGFYSDITEEYYCCVRCRDRAEEEYKEEYWEYSDYDDAYFEEVEKYKNWTGSRFTTETISPDSLRTLINDEEVYEYNGVNYYIADMSTIEALDAILSDI